MKNSGRPADRGGNDDPVATVGVHVKRRNYGDPSSGKKR